MKVNFSELVKGTVLLNKRNRKEFKVLSLDEKEQKVELLNLSSEETVKVSKATFERWYSVQSVPEKEEPKEEPKPVAGPKVAKRTNRRPRPANTTVVVVEAIDKTDDKEVVEIREKRKKQNSGIPKSDTVLSLTKQLEDRIAHDFPASRRGVTQSFIKYSHQYNFVKIFQTKSKIRINVLSRAMPEEMKAKLDRIVPAKYGWPITDSLLLDVKKTWILLWNLSPIL